MIGHPSGGEPLVDVRQSGSGPVHTSSYPGAIGNLVPGGQTVIAAAILRHLHAVITTGQAWDPLIATLGKHRQVLPAAA